MRCVFELVGRLPATRFSDGRGSGITRIHRFALREATRKQANNQPLNS